MFQHFDGRWLTNEAVHSGHVQITSIFYSIIIIIIIIIIALPWIPFFDDLRKPVKDRGRHQILDFFPQHVSAIVILPHFYKY